MTMNQQRPDPKRVLAGRLNRLKRRGITPEGREKLRQLALVNRPWQFATGPRTPEGKARAAANGRRRTGRTGEVPGLLETVTVVLAALRGGRRIMQGLSN
jgi:hypothetical protein